MSGRAYARRADGALGGATDIDSVLPHRFRIKAPKINSRAKELAIRRAIQRRVKEKNWKKLLYRQHSRLFPLFPSTEETETTNEATDETTAKDNTVEAKGNGVLTDGEKHTEQATTVTVTSDGQKDVEMESAVSATDLERQQTEEELTLAQQQLQELEAKLQTLSHEKHRKFLQLKDLLIAEARSKSSSTPSTKTPRLEGALGEMSTTGVDVAPEAPSSVQSSTAPTTET
ncbi:hypothetical protein Poli38472_009489 [Pythium oligandrum]|uniref:Uncharacterized protein n=1 Tax=Pythium oligandrum TaxID=41045 RepID=A0A8K1FGT2_PYTOL|nr:hypothetical protein Poli38472_009489 [Pythium oligandrum]|eukprot:TMW61996.1 hypothetical protein Poli38472_009489 [Pythium oligandrum]